MMKPLTYKTIFFLGVLLLLTGCATIKPEDAQQINRVGAISFLGNDFRIYDFGLTILERRDHKRIDLPEWNLEATVQDTLKEELTKNSRFTYVPISVGKDILEKIQDSVSGNIEEGVREEYGHLPKIENIANDLNHLAKKNKIDTWILVYPDRAQSPIWARKLYITGVGAIRESTVIGKKAAIFTNITVDIVTGDSESLVGGGMPTSSFRNIDITEWEKLNKLPDSDLPKDTISDIKGLISRLLKHTLIQMKLTKERVGG